MATSGQTLNDRINAARYALAGQGLARCVCKATTEEVIGPKKKHLEYLVACTHEPNVSIPQLANLLIERTNHIYWVVVFKALVTVHHLMSVGNERFIQYLASSNYSFELSTFLDKTSARDFSMSTFIRRYSRYINEKALSYRLLAFDLCKVIRGKDGILRNMPIDRLLKTLPILQNQLDALLEFDCSANDLNNGVINACFMLLFRDLIGLFACHNDGIINLLEKYFSLNRKMTKEAYDCYKKFLVRMDKVSEFLRVAEVVGIDKDDIPDLKKVPSSLLETLEAHLQKLENKKSTLKQQSGTSKPIEFGSGIGNLTPPTSRRSNSPNPPLNTTIVTMPNTQTDEATLNSIKDEEVRKALEEEARVLSQYGTDGVKTKPKNNGAFGSNKVSNQDSDSLNFAVTSTVPKSVDDIFGDANSFGTITSNGQNDSNGPTIDTLSTTSSGSSSLKQKLDTNMIKSTIKSATTTLEKSNAKAGTESVGFSAPAKKASDELFSLLEAPSNPGITSTTIPNQLNPLGSSAFTTVPKQPLVGLDSSSFGQSPFDLGSINGQLPVLKPGNPFPSTTTDFDLGSSCRLPTNNITGLIPVQPSVGSVFKTSAPTANYTNLGGLDSFGDLLQPISSTGKNSSNSNNNMGNNKSTFNSNSGLTSTGLFKGDLDTTLANLAQNLTFEGITKTKK